MFASPIMIKIMLKPYKSTQIFYIGKFYEHHLRIKLRFVFAVEEPDDCWLWLLPRLGEERSQCGWHDRLAEPDVHTVLLQVYLSTLHAGVTRRPQSLYER